jgi:hypothetical protein
VAAIATALTVLAATVFGLPAPAHANSVNGSITSGNYYYIISNTAVAMCFDVQGASRNPGTPIQQWWCGSQWNQQFQFVHSVVAGVSVWRLRLRYAPNLCVRVDFGGENAPLVADTCGPGWDQWFVLTATDKYGYRTMAAMYEPGIDIGYTENFMVPGASMVTRKDTDLQVWDSIPF